MALSDVEIKELEQLVLEEKLYKAGSSLSSFLQLAWPIIEPNHPFVPGFHIDAICEHLEAVNKGQIKNLLINIPPRHAKSTIVSVAFPAWVWTQKPGHKFIYASHSYSLSKRDSIKVRALVLSGWYRETFKIAWNISDDQNEKVKFENNKKGFRMAASVGGSVIGEGADTLVVDDPHSPMETESDNVRQSVLDWYDQEFSTRVNDPKTVSRIIIMQRLHQMDLSQHVLNKGNWEHLMLPAEYEPERKCQVVSTGWSDPREEPGEPLWPERFGKKEIEEFKTILGSMASAGQLQQRPAPAEGAIFKRPWFKFHVEQPADLDFIGISGDLTFKDGAKNDYAVFQVWGRKKGMFYLLDQIRGRMGFNEQKTAFKALCAKWHPNAKWIEDTANGPALIAAMRIEVAGIIPIKPRGSKVARAEAITPSFESGNVSIPDPSIAPWVGDYIEELCTFPGALHDDQVDATTQAIAQLSTRPSIQFNADAMSITGPSKWLR
jgi:predicted phage terminase large subunit-like protein